MQVFPFSLGNSTCVIKSVLNRSMSPFCADNSWAGCEVLALVRVEMIKESKSPGQLRRIAKENKTNQKKNVPSGNLEMDKVQ